MKVRYESFNPLVCTIVMCGTRNRGFREFMYRTRIMENGNAFHPGFFVIGCSEIVKERFYGNQIFKIHAGSHHLYLGISESGKKRHTIKLRECSTWIC